MASRRFTFDSAKKNKFVDIFLLMPETGVADAMRSAKSECRAHGLRLMLVLADGGPPPPPPPLAAAATESAGAAAAAAAAAAVAVPASAPSASHVRQYAAWVDRADPDGSSQQLPQQRNPLLGLRDGFFGNNTVKSVFLDAAALVLGRRNTRVDGLAYWHDPTVLGWELLAGAHPGCC
jgi:hypothetical protein